MLMLAASKSAGYRCRPVVAALASMPSAVPSVATLVGRGVAAEAAARVTFFQKLTAN